tara:strand:+ start:34 stop:141 length:108 start_codon:yes stop_codon:yes gene_type:complete
MKILTRLSVAVAAAAVVLVKVEIVVKQINSRLLSN